MNSIALVSPYARVHALPPGAVRWTTGFWAEREHVCRNGIVPALWAIMEGTDNSHYWENFRIAGGLKGGRQRGAPFNDGDFYKLIEASCALLAIEDDPALAARVEAAIADIGRAQRDDGYLHTRILIRQRNGDDTAQPLHDPLEFELYNMGHLLTAACVHFRVTGCDSLLRIACKTANFLEATFAQPSRELAALAICPSHYMGMVDLHRVTGEPRYRDLAQRFLDCRDTIPATGSDDNQDRMPFRQQTEAVGHAVRANYLYAGAADVYMETGDTTLWKPLSPIWNSVVGRKLAITGGCGALYDGASPDGAEAQKTITRTHQAYGRNYQQPQQTAHNETCASIGNVLWNWRMFRVTGEARFIDVLENALYNGILSGVSLEGGDFFYTNPLRCLHEEPCELRWGHTRKPYFGSFCCPPNVARTLAQVNSYACAYDKEGIFVNLYGANRSVVSLPGGVCVTLVQETDYPWNGKVHLRFAECETPTNKADFALHLRIPGWAEEGSVRVHINGQKAEGNPEPGTFLTLRRAWRKGDTIEIEFPMLARLVEAHPLVEEARGQVAVQRGPIVYCLESADLPPEVELLDMLIPAGIHLAARPHPTLKGIFALEGRALARQASSSGKKQTLPLYRTLSSAPLRAISVRLIPYFAWGNRGPTEMSVFLPVHWQATGGGRGDIPAANTPTPS